jgi:hypothetical protein
MNLFGKKRTMKNLSFVTKMILLAIVAIFINACDKDEDVITYDLTGNWKVSSFENYETSTKVTKTKDNTWTQFNNGDNTVSFIASNSTSGVISGINVTNSFSANYTLDQNGKISLSGDDNWTMINEPEWGKLFHSISEAESYEVRNGHLIIFYNEKKNSITFERI